MTDGSRPERAVAASGLTKRFRTLRALDGIDLSIATGESVALFGPNGAGKTTLLRVLTLGLRPDAGTLRVAGLDPRRDDREIRARIGLVSHRSMLYGDLSARENLTIFARLYGVQRPAQRSAELLGGLGLAHRAEDPVRSLSRGMTQRVSLARALVHDPPIMLLDEPFTGLDPAAAALLRRTLERLRDDGRTVVLVTHNLRQGLELSDRWLLLARGRIVEQGRSAETDRATFEEAYFNRLTVEAGQAVRA